MSGPRSLFPRKPRAPVDVPDVPFSMNSARLFQAGLKPNPPFFISAPASCFAQRQTATRYMAHIMPVRTTPHKDSLSPVTGSSSPAGSEDAHGSSGGWPSLGQRESCLSVPPDTESPARDLLPRQPDRFATSMSFPLGETHCRPFKFAVRVALFYVLALVELDFAFANCERHLHFAVLPIKRQGNQRVAFDGSEAE